MRQRQRVVIPPWTIGIRLHAGLDGHLTGGVLRRGHRHRSLGLPRRDRIEGDRLGRLGADLGGPALGGAAGSRPGLGLRGRLGGIALRQVDGDVDGTRNLGLRVRLERELSALTGLDGLRPGQLGAQITLVDDVLGCVCLTLVLIRGDVFVFGLVLVEVVLPGLEVGESRLFEITLGEGGEVVTTGGEEAQRRNPVVLVRIDVLAIDLDGFHVLALVGISVIDDIEVIGDAQVEERPGGTVGLPLLFEEADDVRTLHRHDTMVVGEGKHAVELGHGDFAFLLGVVDVIAEQIGAQTAGVRDAEVGFFQLGLFDAFLERIGDEVAERGLGTAVLLAVLLRSGDVLADRAGDLRAELLGLLLCVADDACDLVDDLGVIALALGLDEIDAAGLPVAVAVDSHGHLPDVFAVAAGLDDGTGAIGFSGHRRFEGIRHMGVAGEHGVDRGVGLGDELLELRVRRLRVFQALGRRRAEVGLDDRHIRSFVLGQVLEIVGDAVDCVRGVTEVEVGDAVR